MVKVYLDLLDQLEEKNLLIQKQDEIIKRLSLKLLESENYKQEVKDGHKSNKGMMGYVDKAFTGAKPLVGGGTVEGDTYISNQQIINNFTTLFNSPELMLNGGDATIRDFSLVIDGGGA